MNQIPDHSASIVVLYLRVPAELKTAIGEASRRKADHIRKSGGWARPLTVNDMAIELIRDGLLVATATDTASTKPTTKSKAKGARK